MKIALISPASSIHTVRWANGLAEAGHEVHVISQHPPYDPFLEEVKVHYFPFRGILGYFLMAPGVKKLLKKIQPDIVNAHYASGYGTTARLAKPYPYLLSVWGDDVYGFPFKSPLHKWLVKKNLKAADGIASTSHCMAEQTRSLVPELSNISITPFGVEMQDFAIARPLEVNKKKIVIGTVKGMSAKYGIDTLIQSFDLLLKNLSITHSEIASQLELRLVGGGNKIEEYKELSKKLGLTEKVQFVGKVPYSEVPIELAKLDIYVALSRWDSESFGVAIIEAGAARRPVLVSDAGGLPEVTLDGRTGIVVPRENPEEAARALEKLVLDPGLRLKMGEAGREHVANTYSWGVCIQKMEKVYAQTIDQALTKK